LERRFKLLQDEKSHKDSNAKERDEENFRRASSLQSEIAITRSTLEDKHQQIRNLENELLRLKDLAGKKKDEIGMLNRNISVASTNASELIKRKKDIDQELAIEANKRREAQLEKDGLTDLNNRLSVQNRDSENIIRENEIEIRRLNEVLDVLNKDIMDTNELIRRNKESIAVTIDDKQRLQKEIDSTMLANRRLEDENKDLELRARDLDIQIDQITNKYKDTLLFIEAKEKDLHILKNSLAVSENRGADARGLAIKTQQENSVLQSLLDRYRGEVETEKRLREQEISRKLAIEEEKKRVERELINNEMAARSIKKELEMVQANKYQLEDNRYQLNSELNALKEHADLLESQNTKVTFTIKE